MKKFQKSLYLVLAIVMILSSMILPGVPGSIIAEAAESITLKVRIEADDHTIVPEKEIEVEPFDLTDYGASATMEETKPIHGIIKALESEGFNCKDSEQFNCNSGNYITNVAGLNTGSTGLKDGWMYYVNNTWADKGVSDYDIKDGDYIVLYFQEDYTFSAYSSFNETERTCETGDTVELSLTSSVYDMGTDQVTTSQVIGAQILVDNQPLVINDENVLTDANGKAELSFDKSGTYIISAKRIHSYDSKDINDISRPYCKIAVQNLTDTEAPIITLEGSEEVKITKGQTYEDAGITITDNIYQGLEAVVTYTKDGQTVENIDTNEIGTYIIHYNVSDEEENAATEAIRTIIVEEKTYIPADSSIPEDYTNDLWLSTNFQILEVDDTYQLTSRRVPEIIDGPISNNVSHPHYDYKIIEGDSVTLRDTTNSNMIITAVKQGTSIIEVGYNETTAYGKDYEAVSRVNKSYMIVDVVEDKETDNGITIDTDIDARSYDTIYFSEGDTVGYSFNVTATGSDSIEVTCNGKAVEGNNNTYTVPLENRSNIIGIIATKGEIKEKLYYVIDARKIEINIENNTRPNQEIAVGDEVKVSFKGITSPIYKLATIYNPTWYDPNGMWGPSYGTTVRYNNGDLGEVLTYDHNQYDLANHNAIKFTVTEEKTYEFTNGHINSEWWGSALGSEKDMSGPGNPNLNAPTNRDDFSTLPDFSIDVNKAVPDIEAPVITLEGSEEVKITKGQTYEDAGVTITDNIYQGLEAVVTYTKDGQTVENVDTNEIGTYIIHYNVSDKEENVATEVTRTVVVEETQNLFIVTRIGNETFSNGDDARIKIKACSNKDEAVEATVIAALYDNSGKMIKYGYINRNIDSKEEVEMSVGFNIPEEGNYIIKAFVWDNMEDMNVLSNTIISINISN